MKRKIEKRRNEIAVEIARQYADLLSAGTESAEAGIKNTLELLVANFGLLETLLAEAEDAE